MGVTKKTNATVFPVIIPTNRAIKTYNFYLYQTDQSLTVIDAGIDDPDCWDAFLNTLQQHDFSLSDISSILLTHHHIDHIGLVNRITEKHPVPVYAYPIAIPRLERKQSFFEQRIAFLATLYEEAGCGEAGAKQIAQQRKTFEQNKHKTINAELRPIDVNETYHFLKVIHVPGHAPDQVAFLNEEKGWLFSGDLLIEHMASNALVDANERGERLKTLLQHIESYKKILAYDITTVFSGHGNIFDDSKAIIEKRLAAIERKGQKLLALIKEGNTTASELAKALYGKKYEQQFHLVISEIIGHLDYLEANGKIEKRRRHGVYHYRAQ